jgi:hypothetical protein
MRDAILYFVYHAVLQCFVVCGDLFRGQIAKEKPGVGRLPVGGELGGSGLGCLIAGRSGNGAGSWI